MTGTQALHIPNVVRDSKYAQNTREILNCSHHNVLRDSNTCEILNYSLTRTCRFFCVLWNTFTSLTHLLCIVLQTTLRSSISRNALMRKQYECVQGEYLALISKMLDELEKEDSTMTVTDMQQVCQSSIYFNMLKLPHSCNMFKRIFHSAWGIM